MEQERFLSYNLNKFNIEINNSLFDCRIYWARVVSSENESLFTQSTKHSFYEIQYALQGKIGMTLGGNRVDFAESNFLIVPPESEHQIVDSDSVGARFIMAFSLKFKEKALKEELACLAKPVPYRETAHMRSLLSAVLKKNYHDEPLRRESITHLMECFLLEVLETVRTPRSAETTEMGSLNENERKVAQIKQFLHEYNGIGLQVSDIAKKFNVSERHLNRVFHAVTGKNLSDAIYAEKLRRIEELTASTELSLREISELCGFSDEYAMNKFFKRHSHINLSEFRRLKKGGAK